jgi:uncharacterized protein (TIGR02265 family)
MDPMGEPERLDAPFVPPTFTGALELEARVQGAPFEGAVKGMFFRSICAEAAARGARVGRERYVPFRGYPLREWLTLMPEAARAAHPGVHPKEGMRRLGLGAFKVFEHSVAGRVLFSMAGRHAPAAAELTARAFDVIGSHGTVRVLVNEPGRVVFGLRNMWDYIDAWHVGVYQGAMRAFGLQGEVRVRLFDLANGDLELRYSHTRRVA